MESWRQSLSIFRGLQFLATIGMSPVVSIFFISQPDVADPSEPPGRSGSPGPVSNNF